MSSDKRTWKCPECGSAVELSIFQLDPLACDACMAKRKSGGSSKTAVSNDAAPASGPMAQVAGLPDIVKIAAGLVVGLLLGLIIGFTAGRLTAPQVAQRGTEPSRSTTTRHDESSNRDTEDDEPDESTRPGSDSKWVKGYTRKDGTKVKGHWAKDSSKKR